jgi:hypothetical protein
MSLSHSVCSQLPRKGRTYKSRVTSCKYVCVCVCVCVYSSTAGRISGIPVSCCCSAPPAIQVASPSYPCKILSFVLLLQVRAHRKSVSFLVVMLQTGSNFAAIRLVFKVFESECVSVCLVIGLERENRISRTPSVFVYDLRTFS